MLLRKEVSLFFTSFLLYPVGAFVIAATVKDPFLAGPGGVASKLRECGWVGATCLGIALTGWLLGGPFKVVFAVGLFGYGLVWAVRYRRLRKHFCRCCSWW